MEMKNGKANPFGWSQHELYYKDKKIGYLESGEPYLEDGFTHSIKIEK